MLTAQTATQDSTVHRTTARKQLLRVHGDLLQLQTAQQLTRQDVARAVPLIGAAREEARVVALLDHHKGDGGPVLRVGVPHAQAGSRKLYTHPRQSALQLNTKP